MFALEINNVNKIYGNKFKALDNVNFRLAQGDFIGLLGVNGAGKTSLISSISGVNSFNGEIKVMGHDVLRDLVNAKKQLGVVPQELAFDPFLTVMQTLKFQSGLYGVSDNQAWIDELLERMHLTDKAHANTRSLSGGMKRRLMVAQALVHKPAVIILDEPTVGVDVEIRKNIWEFISKLHKEGHTILLTTHYLEEVEQLCNKIIMIDKGKVIAESSKQELIEKANGLPSSIEIETMDDKFTSELDGLVLSKSDNKYTLKLENNKSMMQILNTLTASGVVIENININRPKLEDIFLDYLGR
ncbi:MAG: ABC transporter ATP-binding protein [Neisseriaceae bacterium]|nr:MAG: ABC transporter ATP-binding protein [Neisseriaceae bacterium]